MLNVSFVEIPYEMIMELKGSPEDALLLPDEVSIYRVQEDIARMVYQVLLISDAPYEGITFPTEPYNHPFCLRVECYFNKYILPIPLPTNLNMPQG